MGVGVSFQIILLMKKEENKNDGPWMKYVFMRTLALKMLRNRGGNDDEDDGCEL